MTAAPRDERAIARIRRRIADEQCIILDGAIATELQRRGAQGFHLSDDSHWGFDALLNAPSAVRAVHKSYLDAGAEVLTTNTYSVLEAPSYASDYDIHQAQPAHWMDMARAAIELPREVIAQVGKVGEAAVAFSIGGDIETAAQRDTIELLLRLFDDHPPDLILFETLSLIDDNLTVPTIEMLIARGWPVWASFRRCRRGVCGIHGQLWGGPEGDRFGRLAQRLEAVGVEALLINCLPMERVGGTLAWLADFTDLPLGVYPNVGRYVESGWKFDPGVDAEAFVEQALAWRAEGARIIGGCCGVGPKKIALASERLAHAPRGTGANVTIKSQRKRAALNDDDDDANADAPAELSGGWRDDDGRLLYPLPLPAMVVDPGVFVPTQGSYLIWKYLFTHAVGEHRRCLDIGCGVGILAIQLALNGATSVAAVDIQQSAIDNTMTNAFRNGVAERITGMAEDLYSFTPAQRYDLIVASLYQMPTDPRGQYSGHRDVDYWGRNLLDQLIGELPNYLEDDGVAYVMQISMLGARRTEALLRRNGYAARVVDFNLYQFNPVFNQHLDQIKRVEALSDAYHFAYGADEHVMAMYLLEVKKAV
ncbi:MAG: homocysteine S-methyltransferase family protein [bacterium]